MGMRCYCKHCGKEFQPRSHTFNGSDFCSGCYDYCTSGSRPGEVEKKVYKKAIAGGISPNEAEKLAREAAFAAQEKNRRRFS